MLDVEFLPCIAETNQARHREVKSEEFYQIRTHAATKSQACSSSSRTYLNSIKADAHY